MPEETFGSRLRRGWNAFLNRAPTNNYVDYGVSSSYRPDRPYISPGATRSILSSIQNRIALDAASVDIKHVRLDDNGRMTEIMDSSLNYCLSTEANIDQTGRALIFDAVVSMLDEGYVAIVPVETTIDPTHSGSYEIHSLRTGKILEWRPKHIKVQVYNEISGRKEDIILPKSMVAIIENPMYEAMNTPNSTLQRLIRKLSLLDSIDEQNSTGKLDLIIQLPYSIKTEARREQAESRRKDIEAQLTGSQYGIAYTDGTEKITQLNRPIENNMLKEIEYLTNDLYSKLGMTTGILDGSADEKTMLNYNARVIEPILTAIVEEMRRKFLTKTARSQRQSILFFKDPFKLVPVSQIADIADKFTRNEILTSNEVRQIIGMMPSDDPEANVLRNKNLNKSVEEINDQPNNEEDFQNEAEV